MLSVATATLVVAMGIAAAGQPLTVRASADTAGGNPNGPSYLAEISANGRYVAFTSTASDLVPGDGGDLNPDVFARDLLARTTVKVSVDAAGGDANGSSVDPSISADGRYVAFASGASDLVAGDGNGKGDVFVRDLVAGTTVRVSADTAGMDANGSSGEPSISADGRYVAFSSAASDLVPGTGTGPVTCSCGTSSPGRP